MPNHGKGTTRKLFYSLIIPSWGQPYLRSKLCSFCDGFEFGALGTPTQEMVESYEKSDGTTIDWSPWHASTTATPPYDQLEPRFKATVIYHGSVWKGKTMDCSVNGVNGAFMPYREQPYSYGKTTTGYFLRKLMDEKLIDVKGNKSTQSWVEIRFAEVLLNKGRGSLSPWGRLGLPKTR